MPLQLSIPNQQYNIRTFKNAPLSEIAGSLGDLGTLLPLMLSLAVAKSIDLPTTLVFAGLSNIITGIIFRIPLPVQPMKAIAAVSIANGYSITETTSAGIFVSAIILVLSITGLLRWVGNVTPTPIVKGIQIGAGLSLVLSAGEKMLRPLGWTSPSWADNRIWAFAAFLFFLITTGPTVRGSRAPKVPYALIVFVLGLVFALILLHKSDSSSDLLAEPQTSGFVHGSNQASSSHIPSLLSFWKPKLYIPSWRAFRTGALDAGLGQLPLTTLNSIVAVTYLAEELLSAIDTNSVSLSSEVDIPEPPSFTSLGISVALMNLIPTWFGAMPTCHGSGGLAGQWKFGARSGGSVIFLGAIKLLLGLFVNGDWLVACLQQFPRSILGIMVIAAGVELARVGEGLNTPGAKDLWEVEEGDRKFRGVNEQERMERWTVMMITVAGILAFRNDAVGFIAGVLCHLSIRFAERYQTWHLLPSWARISHRGRLQLRGDEDEGEGLLTSRQ